MYGGALPEIKLCVCMRGGGGAVPASCFQKIDMTLSAISPSILEESLLWSP